MASSGLQIQQAHLDCQNSEAVLQPLLASTHDASCYGGKVLLVSQSVTTAVMYHALCAAVAAQQDRHA